MNCVVHSKSEKTWIQLLLCIWTHPLRLEEMGASASKEHSLEKAMEKMKAEWAELRLAFTLYRDTVSTRVGPNTIAKRLWTELAN